MDVFDYIVVGAGSAGCVVARRLSDDPDVRVLLLEAGPPTDDFWVKTPAGMAMMFRHKRFNWNFFTEEVPTLRNRKLYWPRGRGLGGSSAINGMVYVRGDARDFDHWRDLGNPGWGWDDVLPYFKRSEDNDRGANAYHSVGGPMAVSDPVVVHPAIDAFIAAAGQCGLRKLDDVNAGDQDGVGLLQFTIRGGQRETSYDAFVRPVRDRRNLVVKTGVQVNRVLFEGNVAVGVEISEEGRISRVSAAREVVLCAGALSSPHLLMLSGIGSGAMLQKNGVAVVSDRPGVGQNLQDHFSARVQARAVRSSSYNRHLLGLRKYWQGARYVLQKKGYLTLGSSVAAAFVKSSDAMEYPDLELSFRPYTYSHLPSGKVIVDPYDAVSASVYRVRPRSRGEIILRSPDPGTPPAFHPNYLSDPEDISATVSGLRQLRQIMATAPLAQGLREETVPGFNLTSDDQLIDFMQREGHCAFHPAGTCKMGSDPMAVVDARLRVHGVERLRVIDASIMPVVTSGNTNAPAIMIGEKGADMIREDRKAARPAEVAMAEA